MILGLVEKTAGNGSQNVRYVAPLEPLRCRVCGTSYRYGSDDIFEFEVVDEALPLDLR
jgi:hypothetical protein